MAILLLACDRSQALRPRDVWATGLPTTALVEDWSNQKKEGFGTVLPFPVLERKMKGETDRSSVLSPHGVQGDGDPNEPLANSKSPIGTEQLAKGHNVGGLAAVRGTSRCHNGLYGKSGTIGLALSSPGAVDE